MNHSKNTKRTLIASLMAMVLCCTMLLGTTFAWFTDSVTSGNNKIVAGNLDIELYTGDDLTTKVEETTEFFKGIKWEPGVVAYENLKITNEGNLALIYELAVNIGNYNTIGGKSLKDVLQVAFVEDTTIAKADGRDAALKAVSDAGVNFELLSNYAKEGQLVSAEKVENGVNSDTKNIAIVIYWPQSEADNDYNVNNGKTTSDGQPLFVNLGINLFATQYTYESDSFGIDYDTTALVKVSNVEELKDALTTAEAGDAIMLSAGFALESLTIDKDITLLLAGNMITDASFTLTNDAILTLQSGESEGIDVSGAGSLVLDSMTIKAVTEGDSAVALADGSNIKLVAKNTTAIGEKNGDGIEVPETAALDLSGNNLTAIGNGGAEYEDAYYNTTTDTSYQGKAGSGIGNANENVGSINIHDMNNLTAEGYGVHAFGIGGNTSAVTIKNAAIAYVRGGFAESEMLKDVDYGSSEVEGGAAIGANYNNAGVITLTGTIINKAEGGSKSAAIGVTFWNGVTINITNCKLYNIIGGNASAAIGGSRVDNADENINITIADSEISAIGGRYGAAIGSGYDSDCGKDGSPLCTINITGNSKITATGGARAAGIGTGYHNPRLTGSIDATVDITNVSSGQKTYKVGYFMAQDIGYGIADPADSRGYAEHVNAMVTTGPTFMVAGNVIAIPNVATDADIALN